MLTAEEKVIVDPSEVAYKAPWTSSNKKITLLSMPQKKSYIMVPET